MCKIFFVILLIINMRKISVFFKFVGSFLNSVETGETETKYDTIFKC